MHRVSRLVLNGAIVLGIWSSGKLAWDHFQSGEACPILGVVPACYIALAGYLMMTVAVLPRTAKQFAHRLFWLGLGIAGELALLGSAMELIRGGICPQAFGWLPMCYVSFGFGVLIGILYIMVIRTDTGVPTPDPSTADGD